MPDKTRSPTRLSGLTALIANGKWAIKPEQLRDIVTGFEGYLSGHVASETLLAEARDARTRSAEAVQGAQQEAPSVAVLALHGTIFPRGSMMVDFCGAVDAHTFAARVREAAADPSIRSIIIDVDSGGGAVSGVDVAAQAVREAAGVKRVSAIANTMMCSAAYWIASGASEIVATRAAEVGSIGVIGTHTDESALLESEGLKVTYVRSTERKALGQSAEAMDGPVLAQWQSEIGRLHDVFVGDIALGRDVAESTARRWATGDVWFGQEALDAGLVDRIGSLDELVQDHLGAAQPATSPTLRTGPSARVGATPKEGTVLLELKDRTGKVHTLDTEAPTDAQGTLTALEEGAYAAGIDHQKDVIATALGLEPNSLTLDALTQLRAQAADGASYRADLEHQVEQLAVGVYGADSPSVASYAKLAKKADLDDLRTLAADLKGRKSAAYPAGRLSADDDTSPSEGAQAPKEQEPAPRAANPNRFRW